MIKLIVQITSILIVGFSAATMSGDPPSAPSTLYDNGPISPLFADPGLSDPEKVAFTLFESIMQIAEAKIHATSCNASAGSSEIEIFTDGSEENPSFNFIEVISLGGSIHLEANISPHKFYGYMIRIDQNGRGSLAGTIVLNYNGKATFSSFENIMYSRSLVNVIGINGLPGRYDSRVIRDFYRGSTDSQNNAFYIVFDWGLQALHKEGYPINKYWQRSKTQRNNGISGRTVFVKDRLVGTSPCRIKIATEGYNDLDFFFQEGTVTIEKVTPSTPVAAFSE
jgi:hypothetical protein